MGTLTHSGASPPQWAARTRWRRAHYGQGLVEYALILVLIAVIVIGILSSLGAQTSRVFDQVNCTLAGGPTHQDHGNGNSNRCQ